MSGQFALGCAFRTCENFWEQQTSSLVLSQKFSQDTKLPPQFLPLRFCALAQNLIKKINKNHYKSFCYFWLLQKVESPSPSSLREFALANSWQSTIKISRTKCNRISPASWCKKSDLRLQKCNRRFFARSGESEALPLKAKSGSFWRVGGAGWGVQPFCEKKQAILKNKAVILLQNLAQIPKNLRIHKKEIAYDS